MGNYSLLKAALTGARMVYSVLGRMAAARPTSDTMLLKVFWESPISSRPSLADGNHDASSLLLDRRNFGGFSVVYLSRG